MKKRQGKKVLLHSCCAICSGYPIKHLRELGYDPIAYFFNPNICPESEYNKRLEAQKKLCEALSCELIVEDYFPDLYEEIMEGFENHSEGSERCTRCFELRLLKTAQKATELDIENFTTSISISPHKNFDVVDAVGKFFAEHFEPNFLDLNFRKKDGFLQTNKISDELGLYRQDYCGCEVSLNGRKTSKK